MDLNDFRRFPGLAKSRNLEGAVDKLWEALYELADMPGIKFDESLDLAGNSSSDNVVSVVGGILVDGRRSVALSVHSAWDGQRWMEEEFEKAMAALREIGGSRPYMAGDNGDTVIIVITADADRLADAIMDEKAIWLYGLSPDAIQRYSELVDDQLQPVTDEQRMIFEVQTG